VRPHRRTYETELTYEELQNELERWDDLFYEMDNDWQAVEYWEQGSDLFGKLATFAPKDEAPGQRDYYRQMLVHCLLQLGRYHKARGGAAWDRAISLFRDIRSEQPDHSLANYRLGVIYFVKQDYGAAAEAFGRALRRTAVNREHRIDDEQAAKAMLWQAQAYRHLAVQAAERLQHQLDKLSAGEAKEKLQEQADELSAMLDQDARKPFILVENGAQTKIAENELDQYVFRREPGIAVIDYVEANTCYLHLDVGTVKLTTGLADLLRCLFEESGPQSKEQLYQRLYNKPMPTENTAIRKGMNSLRDRLRSQLSRKLPYEAIESLILTSSEGYGWNRERYPVCRIAFRETDTHCADF
jgi:hypothetical protein